MSIQREVRIGSGALLVVVLALAATAMAGPTVAAGASSADTAALHTDDESAVSVSVEDLDGQSFWEGQTLEVGGFDPAETVELEREDDTRQVVADGDGEVPLETDAYETGDWTVVGADSGASGEFTLREQTLNASTGASAFGDPALNLESNRATYTVEVTSDDADAETLAAAIATAEVEGEHAVLEVETTADSYSFGIDTSALSEGEFELTVAVADTSASDTVTLTVEQDPDVTIDVGELGEETVWRGQQVLLTGFDDDETVELVGNESSREYVADDGTILTNTTQFETGAWEVDPGAFGSSGTLVVREQFVDATNRTATETLGVGVVSNRLSYDLAVSSDDLDAETLAATIYGANVSGEQVVVSMHRPGGFTVDASELSGGEYELQLDAVDSTANDTVTLNVSAGVEVEGNHPLPYDGSEVLYDVNGDRVLSNTDVVDFFGFQHYHPAVDEYPELFDFDGDGTVGQGDVVELFEVVNGEPFHDPGAEFVDIGYDVEAGSVAPIEVDVQGTDATYLNVSLEDYDYTATVEATDVSDDTVTIEANTTLMGHDEADGTFSAADADVEFTESGELSDIGPNQFNEQFTFRLRSYAENPHGGATVEDVSRLRLLEPTDATMGAANYTVPEGGVATVDVELENTEEAWLELEHESLEGTGTVHVQNVRRENLTVGVDTASLSQDEPAEDVFGVLGADLGPQTEMTGAFADAGDGQWSEGAVLTLESHSELDSPADDRGRLTVQAPPGEEPDAQFASGPYDVPEGSTAGIEVDVTATDEAWLTFDRENVSETGVLHLENAYADTVTVEVDTEHVAAASAVEDVVDVSGAELGPETSEIDAFAALSGPDADDAGWPVGTDLAVRASPAAPNPTDATDRTRLSITDAPIGAVTAWVAPADVDPADAESGAELLEDATQSDSVAYGDLVVARVEADTQTQYVGANASDFDAADQALQFYLERANPGPFGQNTETFPIGDVADEVTLFVDEEEDQFFVAVDSSAIAGSGDEMTLRFAVGPENDHRDDVGTEPLTREATLDVDEPSVEFQGEVDDDGRLLVRNADDARIGLETNLAPGTDGDVSVETWNGTVTDEVTVDEDGVASATFDFSRNEPGEIFDVTEATLFGSQDVTTATEGQFVAADGPPFDVSASAPEETGLGTATIEATVRNDGEQTDVAEVTVTADGDEVSSFTAELEPGEEWSGSYQVGVGPGDTTWSVETQTDSVEGTIEYVEPV